MAIFKSTPMTEDVRKSISNQTFAIVRGQNVARKKISRNSSKTVPQQQQRARIKRMADVEELFDLSSEIGFPKRPATWTTANAFTSANLKNGALTVDDSLEVTVDYAQILCSQGRDADVHAFRGIARAQPQRERQTLCDGGGTGTGRCGTV